MKMLKIILFLFFLIGINTQTQAQFWKKIKNKVQKKAEDKLDKKTDKIIDKAFERNKKEEIPTNLQVTYKFNQSISIEVTADDTEKVELELLFNSQNKNTVCMILGSGKPDEMGGEVYNVITPKNTTMFMNISGIKMKKIVVNEDVSQFDNSKKIPNKDDLVKTGKIKSILGFACHEYKYENDGGAITAWVTKEKFPIDGKFIPMLGMKENSPLEGFVMELAFTSASGNGSVKVVKINKNRNIIIKTKEYKSLGF